MGRPLFRRRPQRSAVFGLISISLAHYGHKLLPETTTARILAEMVVAFVALTAMTLFVLAHHNRSGHARLMNQTQEEVVLIGIFGLFWFAFLIGLRAWNERHVIEQVDQPSRSEPAWGTEPLPIMESAQIRRCPGGTLMCVMEGISW